MKDKLKNIQIFQYNESAISFQMGDETMINATEMAKLFNKRTNDWLSTKQAKELTDLLSAKTGIPATGLVIVNQGGNKQGTWMHSDIALVFAQWLSPEFYFWCNDRVKELFSFGITATDEMLVKAATDPEFVVAMMDQVKQSRQRSMELEEHNRQLQAQIEENMPKVNFYDTKTNLDAEYNKRKTILISKIASKFEIPVKILNKFLIRKLVIVRVDGGYDIHPQYADADIAYQVVRQEPVYDEFGDVVHPGIKYMEYTPKGVELIIKLLTEENMLKESVKS